uniref:Aminopeptidase n=1 Tax=candidate division WOR-3 bacterium TaxID=2052148 RepID=A0A7C6A8S2_UNCW3
MTDPRIEKMAEVLTQYSLALKKGDLFRIDGSYLAESLIKAVYKEALLLGAHPYTMVTIEGLQEIFYKNSSDDQLKFVSEIDRFSYEKLDANLTIWGEWNTKYLSNVSPQRIATYLGARKELFNRRLERIAQHELRWCGTLFPTQANAQDAEMSLAEFEDFVFAGALVDKPDPIKEWQKLSNEQATFIQELSKCHQFRVKALDTDLTFQVNGRKWINCDGHLNFPDGEIFTCPIEESVQGTIRFTYPAVYQGKEVEDVRLQFAEGKVVKASAAKGEEFLNSLLNTDAGAKYVGEFSFGNNYGIQRFIKHTLFDEKIGGTIHLALGAALPEAGGKNKSGIHWDMVCDLRKGGEIYGDGELIYQNGKFLI